MWCADKIGLHQFDPLLTTTTFFDAYADWVFGRGSRDAMEACGVPKTERIRKLMDTQPQFESTPIVYEVSQRDIDETFRTGLMTNAVFDHVLAHLRKIAPPSYRICALEDYAECDFVSFARGLCERGITEILSSTAAYDTPGYDDLYRRVKFHADEKLDELVRTAHYTQKQLKRKSLHIDGKHSVYVCPFLHAGHYVLVVIDFERHRVCTYDSLRGESEEPSTWEEFALRWLAESEAYHTFSEFDVEPMPVAYQGVNECGFAVCVFMRQWVHAHNADPETYAQFKETLRNELVPRGTIRTKSASA